jgi:hypothetical protein
MPAVQAGPVVSGTGYTSGMSFSFSVPSVRQCPCRTCRLNRERLASRDGWGYRPDIAGMLERADLASMLAYFSGQRRGFATGGIVAADSTPEKVPEVSSGLPGFSHAEFVPGTVRGFRWWNVDAPPLHLSPFSDRGQAWMPRYLHGQRDTWAPGENIAECKPDVFSVTRHPGVPAPVRRCACGFWAYWTVRKHDLGSHGDTKLPVFGVVEGSGKVLIGPEGFRAAKAKIIALYLPSLIHPDIMRPEESAAAQARAGDSLGQALQRNPRFAGRVVHFPGRDPDTDGYWSPYVREPQPEPEPPSEEEIREAEDRALAWPAVIADRLSQLYPDAEICESAAYMTAKYPVTSEYPDT